MKILKDYDNITIRENEYPFIPLREMVIFPSMQRSFYVGRSESIQAVEISKKFYENIVFLATQKDPNVENPKEDEIYRVGVLAKIVEQKKGPDHKIIKLVVTGIERGIIKEFVNEDNIKKVLIEKIDKEKEEEIDAKTETLLEYIIKEFKKFSALARISNDTIKDIINKSDNINSFINAMMSLLKSSIENQIAILEETDSHKRLMLLAELISSNIEIIQLEKKITQEVRNKMERSQKEYFLHEQMKEIQKELGNLNNDDVDIFSNPVEFSKKLDEIGVPEYVKQKTLKEHKRLLKMPPISPESSILRTYLEWIIDLPWKEKREDLKDLKKAKEILDKDHYGLKKVKERIIEFLAVRQLNQKTKGPILCFIGPPGTGKTSLGKSVANAIGREFIRISLGGVRDEAEIRGHRRTYLGALPGKIIQSMKKVKSINPVFLLDEIDKMSSDFRGDPASALLEVLDPEQNSGFVDHYLEVPYNLSEVMFITTANSISGIPYPLLDRMEIINISSYTEMEKFNIAKFFLIPREKEENGLQDIDIKITNKAIIDIIRYYTMEAGVRALQRNIAKIFRKIAKFIVLNKKIEKIIITSKNLQKFLGKKIYLKPDVDEILDIGIAHGLAWSEIGGSILPIEIVLYPGSGKIILTGKLGEVMKESAQTAFSYIRANAFQYDIKYKDFYKDYDVHIHFPEGAIPKDGPSAGIAIASAILSALTKEPLHSNTAMTGEITLAGKVLPIGGLKEKILAAARHKKKIIILPYENEKDLVDIPKSIKKRLEFKFVKRVEDVFKIVFSNNIYAKPEENKEKIENSNIIKIDQNIQSDGVILAKD